MRLVGDAALRHPVVLHFVDTSRPAISEGRQDRQLAAPGPGGADTRTADLRPGDGVGSLPRGLGRLSGRPCDRRHGRSRGPAGAGHRPDPTPGNGVVTTADAVASLHDAVHARVVHTPSASLNTATVLARRRERRRCGTAALPIARRPRPPPARRVGPRTRARARARRRPAPPRNRFRRVRLPPPGPYGDRPPWRSTTHDAPSSLATAARSSCRCAAVSTVTPAVTTASV